MEIEMPKRLCERQFEPERKCLVIHRVTYIHSYNQRVISWLKKEMAASSGLSCSGQNIPWEYTSLLIFILYLLSAHNLASYLFCLQGKNVLVTTTGVWWSLWRFWLFCPHTVLLVVHVFLVSLVSMGLIPWVCPVLRLLTCWGFWIWWVKKQTTETKKNSW